MRLLFLPETYRMSIRTREIIGKAILETLETRQMMSTVTLVDGTLVVQGNEIETEGLSGRAGGQADIHVAR